MKDKKSILLATAIATVFLIAAIGSASANGVCCVDYPACTQYFSATDTITQSCTFNDTMFCTACTGKPAVHALAIGVDDITIDGNGYALIGNVNAGDCEWIDETNPQYGCCGILNLDGYDNVTIKNLEISNFCNGIGFKGAWNNWVEDNTIDNCDIHDNGFNTGWSVSHGIHALFTKNSTIINNTIHHNKGTGDGCGDGGNGIFLYGSGSGPNYLLIHNNTLYNNRKSGFFTKMMMRYSTLSNNTAYGNGYGGSHECAGINFRCINTDHNVVEYNNCSGNSGTGIYIGGKYNDIRYNTANNNTCKGIFLGRSDGGSRDNDIYNNTVCRNQQHGIYIVNQPGNTLHNNTVCENGGEDIYDNDATTGDNNICDTAFGYSDTSAIPPNPCVYQCPGAGPDLVISDLIVEWAVKPTTYNITYTVKNVGRQSTGGSTSNTSVTADGTPVSGSPYFCPALASGASNTTTVGPFPLTTPHDTIVVCADSLSQVTEPGYGDEDNNCKTDVFGAPDLVVTHFWTTTPQVNDSYKRYDLTYTVENVGDRATPSECRTNFTELHGEWSGCLDPVPIPAGLAEGDSVTHIVGPFVLGGDHDWVQVWVNFEHVFPENVEDDLHGNRARFCPECNESACGCDLCGDVDGNTAVNIDDGKRAAKLEIDTCRWAADADCSHSVNIDDGKRIAKLELNCCDPCCVL